MLSQILISAAALINAVVMLRGRLFSRATAWVGIAISFLGLGVLVPGIGPLLSLLGTAGAVVWNFQVARVFRQIGWGQAGRAALGRV
jgi:hypothetical protein